MRNYRILLASLLLFFSCNKSTDKEFVSEVKPSALAEETITDDAVVGGVNSQAVSIPRLNTDTSRKIIKTGEMSFESKDVALTRKRIIAATKKVDGYISEEKESGYENDRKEYILCLKIPAKSFDTLLNDIASTADKIDSKNIKVEDITSEYTDTRIRIENKKRLENRYLELLQKAVKISDMLQIESKLSEIRNEIESVEAQFAQMKKQVAYSSITVTFYSQSISSETGKDFLYMIGHSLAEGMDYIEKIFYKTLSLWPFILVICLVFVWYKKRKRS